MSSKAENRGRRTGTHLADVPSVYRDNEMGLKLKGRLTSRLSFEKRKKMERTLARMDAVREEDAMRLRDAIGAKMTWLQSQKERSAKELIELNDKKNELLRDMIIIDSVLMHFQQVLDAEKAGPDMGESEEGEHEK